MKPPRTPNPPMTGWPPGMLQDDSRELSAWLSNRIDSRTHAREAAEEIKHDRSPTVGGRVNNDEARS